VAPIETSSSRLSKVKKGSRSRDSSTARRMASRGWGRLGADVTGDKDTPSAQSGEAIPLDKEVRGKGHDVRTGRAMIKIGAS